MKCLICGNKLNSDNKSCPCCNIDTNIRQILAFNFTIKVMMRCLK